MQPRQLKIYRPQSSEFLRLGFPAQVAPRIQSLWRSERDTAQYPINQQIVVGEPAVSQDRQATDIQQSYIEHDRLSFTQSEADWQFNCITDNGISSSVKEPEWDWSNAKGLELMF